MCKRSIMKPQNESARPALPAAPPPPLLRRPLGMKLVTRPASQDGKEAERSLARFFAESELLADLEGILSLSRSDEKPGEWIEACSRQTLLYSAT